ncbi:MAG TPA: hypothetical protein VLF91_02670 [Candidatus Saccharimonadales bacterium]|nr:hypothetical protein [Candidatus Saccharimonadales bacterium]
MTVTPDTTPVKKPLEVKVMQGMTTAFMALLGILLGVVYPFAPIPAAFVAGAVALLLVISGIASVWVQLMQPKVSAWEIVWALVCTFAGFSFLVAAVMVALSS